MVSLPTQADVRLAFVVWSLTLASYFAVVPAIVALRRSSASVTWPWREAICLAVGLLIIGLFFDFLPRRPELMNSDLELAFVCYMLASFAFVSAVAKMFSTWKARSWSRFAAASSVVATSGATIVVASWAVVYFE